MDNLLNWSRLQLKKINPYFAGFSVKETLSSNLRFLEGHIDQKKITVRILQFDDVKVYGDVDMISVIIRNILSNAIKYSHEEGLITVSGKVQKNNVFALSISDNGVGIEKQDIDNLFNLNLSKSKQGTNNELGTGLGLILCQEFALINKCKLTVESEKGKGSTFTIFIPIEE